VVLCSPQILALVSEKKRQPPLPNTVNLSALRQAVVDAIGWEGGAGKFPIFSWSTHAWLLKFRHVGTIGAMPCF